MLGIGGHIELTDYLLDTVIPSAEIRWYGTLLDEVSDDVSKLYEFYGDTLPALVGEHIPQNETQWLSVVDIAVQRYGKRDIRLNYVTPSQYLKSVQESRNLVEWIPAEVPKAIERQLNLLDNRMELFWIPSYEFYTAIINDEHYVQIFNKSETDAISVEKACEDVLTYIDLLQLK